MCDIKNLGSAIWLVCQNLSTWNWWVPLIRSREQLRVCFESHMSVGKSRNDHTEIIQSQSLLNFHVFLLCLFYVKKHDLTLHNEINPFWVEPRNVRACKWSVVTKRIFCNRRYLTKQKQGMGRKAAAFMLVPSSIVRISLRGRKNVKFRNRVKMFPKGWLESHYIEFLLTLQAQQSFHGARQNHK